MCIICDGTSYAEYANTLLEQIGERGWALSGVEPGPQKPPWSYTLGLTQSFGHPEFLVVGLEQAEGDLLLSSLAQEVASGVTLEEDEIVELGDHCFSLGWVHPRQFEHGVLATWSNVLEPVSSAPLARKAIQVFPPDCLAAYGGRPQRWALNTPRHVLQ